MLNKLLMSKPAVFVRRLVEICFLDHLGTGAAALSYYLLFSFFPITMVIYATLAMVHIDVDAMDKIFTVLMPEQVADIIHAFFQHLSMQDNVTFLILGIALTLFTMTRYMQAMKEKISEIFQDAGERHGLLELGVSILLSIIMLVTFYLTLFLLMTGESLFDFLGRYIYLSDIFIRLWLFFRYILIAACIFVVLGCVFQLLPGIRQKLRHILPGTIFAMLSWFVISLGFSYYMDHFANYSIIYGSIGALIIMLLWFYLTNMLILIGFAINSINYEKRTKGRITTHTAPNSLTFRQFFQKSDSPQKDKK